MTIKKLKPAENAISGSPVKKKQKPINPDDFLSEINKQTDALNKIVSRFSKPLEDNSKSKKIKKNK